MSNGKDVSEILEELFMRAKAQFGSAVKSHWFYTEDPCPGCGTLRVGSTLYKGKSTLSLNAFIYRKEGVLIGYLLCAKCALSIFKAAEKNPSVQTPLHATIEVNLVKAYQRFTKKLEA